MTAKQQRGCALGVLVVDDYPGVAESLARYLAHFGHILRVAVNGPDALRQAQANWPDVLLLDLAMPGMDGYQVARHIRELSAGKKQPLVVATTGSGSDEEIVRCQSEGFDCHLEKPIDLEALQGMLARVQEGKSRGTGNVELRPAYRNEPRPRRASLADLAAGW